MKKALTVKQLIQVLSKLPENAQVFIRHDDHAPACIPLEDYHINKTIKQLTKDTDRDIEKGVCTDNEESESYWSEDYGADVLVFDFWAFPPRKLNHD